MKLPKCVVLLAGSLSLAAFLAGCGGGGGPEAIPTGSTPNYEKGDIVKVEGQVPKERKKNLKEGPGPMEHP